MLGKAFSHNSSFATMKNKFLAQLKILSNRGSRRYRDYIPTWTFYCRKTWITRPYKEHMAITNNALCVQRSYNIWYLQWQNLKEN